MPPTCAQFATLPDTLISPMSPVATSLRPHSAIAKIDETATVPHLGRMKSQKKSWAYRHAPAVRGKLKCRQEGQPPEVVAYSWAAQCRLHSTYRKPVSYTHLRAHETRH